MLWALVKGGILTLYLYCTSCPINQTPDRVDYFWSQLEESRTYTSRPSKQKGKPIDSSDGMTQGACEIQRARHNSCRACSACAIKVNIQHSARTRPKATMKKTF